MKPITVFEKELIERLDSAGIDGNFDRWSEGIDHNLKSTELFELIRAIDWLFFGDFFGWKAGGDGDNGEIFMYELDILFDLLDKEEGEVK